MEASEEKSAAVERSIFSSGLPRACFRVALLGCIAWCVQMPGAWAQAEVAEETKSAAAEEEAVPPELEFPNKPIRLLVYTGPGGLIDLMARKFADVARTYAPEQPIVVINRPGAGGIVAFEEVLRQPADGYHFLAVTRSNVTKLVSAGREDLLDGVVWYASMMSNPHIVITNRNSGLDTWEAVRRDAERRDGRQLWLGVDIGGVKHVSGLQVWREAGIEARWIPFGSGGQASAALLGEIGQVYFGNPSAATGNPDLVPVAVCASRRLQDLPDTPTFRELGVDGLENELIWRGFAFPKGTPEPVLAWYDDLIRKVDADEAWREQWRGEGLDVEYQPRAALEARVAEDRAIFREVLEPLGLLRSEESEPWFGVLEPEASVQAGNLILVLLFIALAVFVLRSDLRRMFGSFVLTSAVIFAALSVFLMSLLLPPPNRIDLVGAAGVPRLWALALVLLAAGYLVVLSRRGRAGEEAGRAPDEVFVVVVAWITLYPFAIATAGYFLATLVAFPLLLWVLGMRKPLAMTALTTVWLVFAWFVFQRTLQVDLPAGWLAALDRFSA